MSTGDLLQKTLNKSINLKFWKKYFFVIMSEEEEKKQFVCKRGRCGEREREREREKKMEIDR
jgi:hypothetical protein